MGPSCQCFQESGANVESPAASGKETSPDHVMRSLYAARPDILMDFAQARYRRVLFIAVEKVLTNIGPEAHSH